MEAVISMSALAGRQRFERSCLPVEAQLDLHVDGQEFLSLVQLLELEGESLEKLAEAAHEVYRESLAGKAKAPEAAKLPYARLPAYLQDQNRENVRDIYRKLIATGYTLTPARSNEPPFNFPGEDLERLAEMEHERWLAAKVATGWRYGPRRNPKTKANPAILPWRKLSARERAQLPPAIAAALGPGVLPNSEKDKDRALVRGIPRILAKAGFAVVKLRAPKQTA